MMLLQQKQIHTVEPAGYNAVRTGS